MNVSENSESLSILSEKLYKLEASRCHIIQLQRVVGSQWLKRWGRKAKHSHRCSFAILPCSFAIAKALYVKISPEIWEGKKKLCKNLYPTPSCSCPCVAAHQSRTASGASREIIHAAYHQRQPTMLLCGGFGPHALSSNINAIFFPRYNTPLKLSIALSDKPPCKLSGVPEIASNLDERYLRRWRYRNHRYSHDSPLMLSSTENVYLTHFLRANFIFSHGTPKLSSSNGKNKLIPWSTRLFFASSNLVKI